MERLFGRFKEASRRKENTLPITITPEASAFLGRMLLRPNPRLSEFIFFGLGGNEVINEIAVANENSYHPNSGLRVGLLGITTSGVSEEWIEIMQRLEAEDKIDNILVVGHSHPSGRTKIKGVTFTIPASDSLLEPSMGSVFEGGPTKAHDLRFAYDLHFDAGFPHEYFGIASPTHEGPKFRIYRTEDLTKIKRANDIDKVPQKTIKLI